MHLAIKKIKQIDNYHFEIEWSDGIKASYRLSNLQNCCPCASCVDEMTLERKASTPPADKNVRAKTIQSIGRYAIKIDFTSGCSSGIYSYQLLRELT